MENKWWEFSAMNVSQCQVVSVDERWKISLEVGKDSKQSCFMVTDESIHSRSRLLDQK